MIRLWIGTVAVLACGLLMGACTDLPSSFEEADPDNSHEASMNFDLEGVEPFLQRLAGKLDGFGPEEIALVMRGVSEMAVDEERDWRFTVNDAGSSVPLRVHVFLDDTDAPDLYFFTSQKLASLIQEELNKFAQEQGW